MDVIRDSIENRADDACKAQVELRKAAIYAGLFRQADGLCLIGHLLQCNGKNRFLVRLAFQSNVTAKLQGKVFGNR